MRSALLFFGLLFFGQLSAQVVITEINYNNPGGDDYEFIELFNAGSTDVDLAGYAFTSGVDYVFPAVTVAAGQYVVIAEDAPVFQAAFGGNPLQWDNGGLNNSGETILLSDPTGGLVDSVAYEDGGAWPSAADGDGPSLILCDASADNNDPANWQTSTNPTGVLAGTNMDEEIFASPGAGNSCNVDPQVGFFDSERTVNEDEGTVEIGVLISIGMGNPTTVTIDANAASTADAADYGLTLPLTLTFDGSQADDTLFFDLTINDDDLQETTETLVLDIIAVDNNGSVFGPASTYTLSIIDNDTPLTSAMVLTGVFDAQPGAAGTKGIELQVVQDIPDASIFGIGSANNGGGSDGVEFTFPAIALTAGTCVHVADDSLKFVEFFGFPATFINGVASINGDDAIELFENQQVIDVFGEIDTDGSGEPWEYLDGWAYRDNASGPDGSTFVLDNWNFSGVDALEGVATNADAAQPFPACEYSSVPPAVLLANNDQAFTAFNTPVDIDVLSNDDIPDATGLTFQVTTVPVNGTVTPIGAGFTYTPDQDFCGQDQFVYTLTAADGMTSSAEVYVDVECPSSYPQRNIADLTTVDADGLPDSLGITAEISGVVYGVDLQGGDAVQFTLIDATGGIAVFSGNNYGYDVMQGDALTLRGEVTQFNGLTQFSPDTIIFVSADNTLIDPLDVTTLDESTESELVTLSGLTYVSATPTGMSGINYTVTDGTNDFIIRVDNDTEIFDGLDLSTLTGTFSVTGIGGQFDNSVPYTSGYQLLPRFLSDIVTETGIPQLDLSARVSTFPNPMTNELLLRTDVELVRIELHNHLGQRVRTVPGNTRRLDVAGLPSGVYLLTLRTADGQWSTPVVK